MPYYHGTFHSRLPSIRKHGLGGLVAVRNFPDAEPGVYLATTPEVCIAMLIDHYMETGEHIPGRPIDHMQTFCVIVVDDSRVDPRLLAPDPQVGGFEGTLIYRGVIDIPSMPVLDLSQIIPDAA